ncbi:MAG TPA: SDR family oxidoreductase [Candidatus Saccharimonadales bacterium]|jgi:short-subunit dehydrogenase
MVTEKTSGKVAVITGASSGIGLATALAFAEQGYNVVLAARRLQELEQAAAECKAHGVGALAVAVDTTDDQAVHQLGQVAVQTFGHIDIWVNNAAVYLTGKFEDVPIGDMRRLMDTNFFGYVHGSMTALTLFRAQTYGTLINVSSVNAAAPQPYVSIYSASKAAVRTLDESLRMELRLDGLHKQIHVCTVMPASVDTNLFQNGANYSGRRVQAIEPVYDPQYAAKHIVGLAHTPKREIIIGPAGKLMALHNAHMPASYEKQVGRFTRADLLDSEQAAPLSTGNLYAPLEENRGMRGGWREERVRADKLNAGMGIGLAVAAGMAGLGFWLLRRSSRS